MLNFSGNRKVFKAFKNYYEIFKRPNLLYVKCGDITRRGKTCIVIPQFKNLHV